jgi:hypothetical protein
MERLMLLTFKFTSDSIIWKECPPYLAVSDPRGRGGNIRIIGRIVCLSRGQNVVTNLDRVMFHITI